MTTLYAISHLATQLLSTDIENAGMGIFPGKGVRGDGIRRIRISKHLYALYVGLRRTHLVLPAVPFDFFFRGAVDFRIVLIETILWS